MKNVNKEIWPNFFIVGAEKAGTTSLYEYLKKIPKIYLPSLKEPYYFSPVFLDKTNSRGIKDKKSYLNLYSDVTDEIAIGDASATYLHEPDSAINIFNTIPNAKIIIMLRNPITRSFSHYLMLLRFGQESLPFNEALKKDIKSTNTKFNRFHFFVIEHSFYYNAVKNYLKIFKEKNVKIVFFEEFIKDPNKTISNVLKFLGVHTYPEPNVNKAYNQYAAPRNKIALSLMSNKIVRKIIRHTVPPYLWDPLREKILVKSGKKPSMNVEEKSILLKIFNEDVKNLQNLLGKKLPWDDFFKL